MSSQGPLYPSTLSASNPFSQSGAAWTSPSNAGADDGSNAQWAPPANEISQALLASNFGFAIGSGTLDGVVVEAELRKSSNLGFASIEMFLQDDISTPDQTWTKSVSDITTTMTNYTFGGASDTWGTSGGLTMSEINSSNFGVVMQGQADNTNTVTCDYIRITVYYTPTFVTMAGTVSAAATADAGTLVRDPMNISGNIGGLCIIPNPPLSADKELGGTITALSSILGGLENFSQLGSASCAAFGNATGAITLADALVGTITAQSDMGGLMQRDLALPVGTIVAISTATADLRAEGNLGNVFIQGMSAASGELRSTKEIAGSLAAQSTVVGFLNNPLFLGSASCAAVSTLIAMLDLQGLRGSITAVSSVTGNAVVDWALNGTVAALAAVNATLERGPEIAGVVSAFSGVFATPRVNWSLAGVVTCVASANATLRMEYRLNGVIAGLSDLPAATIIRQPSIRGSIDAVSSLAPLLSADRGLVGGTGGQTDVQGRMPVDRDLVGSIGAVSTAAGTVTNTTIFAGSVTATTTVVGILGFPHSLKGTVNGSSSITATARLDYRLVSSGVQATSTVNASASADKTLAAGVAATTAASAVINRQVSIQGLAEATSTVAGSIVCTWSLRGAVAAASACSGLLTGEWILRGRVEARCLAIADLDTVLTQGPYRPTKLHYHLPGLQAAEVFMPIAANYSGVV